MTRAAMRMLTTIFFLAGIAPQLAAAQSTDGSVADDSAASPLLLPLLLSPATPAPLPATSPSADATAGPEPGPPLAPSSAPATASPSPFNYSFQPPPPPGDEPRIIEIDLTDRVVRSGPMQLRVLTDSSVTSVFVHAAGRWFTVPQQSPGVFAALGTVPDIPFFIKGRTYWVDFVATGPTGRQTIVSLTIVLN